jgi:hypothetical protein
VVRFLIQCGAIPDQMERLLFQKKERAVHIFLFLSARSLQLAQKGIEEDRR